MDYRRKESDHQLNINYCYRHYWRFIWWAINISKREHNQ